ncbi:hypothetical protein PybrP1_008323 [[Pythium] brassicae (nom. inval.)]|nr:hypothetical protein PybrP1_008323 [[Pythium] brassicae (nom. inval.)]
MSRVFHRRSSAARRSAAMAASDARASSNNSGGVGVSSVGVSAASQLPWSVVEAADIPRSSKSTTLNPLRRRRLGSTLYIPENEPVALDWGVRDSSSNCDNNIRNSNNNRNRNSTDDLRKSSRARPVDVESRLLVQRLILEELQRHNTCRRRYGRYSGTGSGSGSKQPVAASSDARMSMAEHAAALSAAFLEGRGSELLLPSARASSSEDVSGGGGNRDPQQQQQQQQPPQLLQLTRKEERKLRKSVARAVRSDEKQQKKLEKLNEQRAKLYARAQAFFEQTTVGVMQDVSVYRSSALNPRQPRSTDAYCVDSSAADARWRRLSPSSSESLSSSLSWLSKQESDTAPLVRSCSKPPRMEFLFFGGSPDDGVGSNADLEFGYRRYEPSAWGSPHDTEPITVRPSLVRNVPRPFEPRMQRKEVFL